MTAMTHAAQVRGWLIVLVGAVVGCVLSLPTFATVARSDAPSDLAYALASLPWVALYVALARILSLDAVPWATRYVKGQTR